MAHSGPPSDFDASHEPGEANVRAESPTPDEKRAAVEQALQSATLLRSGQLRSFLRYICEMELAGKGAELNEHLIGVEALGRRPGYSTGDDSSVRRQAHALRQKLDELYAGELRDALLQIQLPRGSYLPRFVHAPSTRSQAQGPRGEPSSLPRDRAKRLPAALAVVSLAGAFALGVLAAAAFRGGQRPSAPIDPVLLEAWGPLARRGANVVVCLSTHGHLGVLTYPEGPLPPWVWRPRAEEEAEITAWYRQYWPLAPGHRIALHKTTGPIRLGEVRGLVSAVRFLDRAGVDVEIVAEKNVAFPDLRGRNLLLLGNPEWSVATEKLLERAELTIDYDPALRERVVRSRRADGPIHEVFTPKRDLTESLSEAFGLVTVLPGAESGGADPTRTIVVSCTNSAGCQAGMEFVTSAASMRGLLERLRAAGLRGFPDGYQVVVRSRVQAVQAISAEYVSHVVLHLD